MPMRLAIRSRRKDRILSTMTCDGFCRPFDRDGRNVIRNSGAATSVEVMGQTDMLEWVSLKRSDWTTNAGRGLP